MTIHNYGTQYGKEQVLTNFALILQTTITVQTSFTGGDQ